MKKNLILLCSLFMATALISSCAQDAMEPEVDAAATGAETRAYGDTGYDRQLCSEAGKCSERHDKEG